ncbi:MAG: hypothetical protein QMB14_03790 [Polaromonas sp.]
MQHALTCQSVPLSEPRYADTEWALWPFCALASTHGMAETWWKEATLLRGAAHAYGAVSGLRRLEAN